MRTTRKKKNERVGACAYTPVQEYLNLDGLLQLLMVCDGDGFLCMYADFAANKRNKRNAPCNARLFVVDGGGGGAGWKTLAYVVFYV